MNQGVECLLDLHRTSVWTAWKINLSCLSASKVRNDSPLRISSIRRTNANGQRRSSFALSLFPLGRGLGNLSKDFHSSWRRRARRTLYHHRLRARDRPSASVPPLNFKYLGRNIISDSVTRVNLYSNVFANNVQGEAGGPWHGLALL